MNQRNTGFDVARALAVFGMVIVNFNIVMQADDDYTSWSTLTGLFEGRASALFVILAGVGITFLTNKAGASTDASIVSKSRMMVVKRGILLIIIGLMYTPIWEADILHFYGFYFLFAATFFTVSNRALFLIAVGFTLAFPLLMLLFDYEKNWDWDTLSYMNFWSVDGMVRHIAFNGFHPVFPWTAFLVFGMWLGRQDLSQKPFRIKLVLSAFITFVVIEAAFYWMSIAVGDNSSVGMTAEEAGFLLSISVIPPLPQYIISASCTSVMVLIVCLYFSEQFSTSAVNKVLYKTGQLSLTLYVAHVILGMGMLEYLGRLENQTAAFSFLSALVFCIFGLVFSVVWLSRFKVGPLEWIFRKLAS
jgi:uncharacterized membrane protein YeiB